ncbi:hypothetical protein TKK_0007364 [Trichogramma kaykai]
MPKVDKKFEKRSRNGVSDTQHVGTFTQSKLDRLKNLREKVNWEIEGERQIFLRNSLRTGGTNIKYKFHAATLFFDRIDKLNRALHMDAQDNYGNTALHLALNVGYEQLAIMLLKRGANPNLANGKGLTPLHIICQSKYNVLIEQFLEITNQRLKPV